MTGRDLTVWALPLGAALDALLGDPHGWQHPVRAIGRLVAATEAALRWGLTRARLGARAERLAGVLLAAFVVSASALAAWSVVAAADHLGGPAGLLARALLIYWGLAARSLGDEALRVSNEPDLLQARRGLAMIVGRDTERLEREAINRACVETVAENTSDAVVAPLFWFALLGLAGLWGFKAVSTLDSMVGYRDARYERLGWASARLDDLACLLPARLTWLLLAVAAALMGESCVGALRVGWRDGRKHPSPNAAWSEAAMAGALGVQLGGEASYGGVVSEKPGLGDPLRPIEVATVRRAVHLMQVTAILAVALAWAARVAITRAA